MGGGRHHIFALGENGGLPHRGGIPTGKEWTLNLGQPRPIFAGFRDDPFPVSEFDDEDRDSLRGWGIVRQGLVQEDLDGGRVTRKAPWLDTGGDPDPTNQAGRKRGAAGRGEQAVGPSWGPCDPRLGVNQNATGQDSGGGTVWGGTTGHRE